MPPALKAAFASSNYRPNLNDLSTTPDTDSPRVDFAPATEPEPEPELPSRTSKKKKKLRQAAKEEQTLIQLDKHWNGVVTPEESSPLPVVSKTVASIPRAFPTAQSKFSSTIKQDDVAPPEKVSDQFTLSDDKDAWEQDNKHGQSQPTNQYMARDLREGSPAQVEFHARGGFSTKSPPVSPRQRLSRPVSYINSITPPNPHARASSSPYSRGLDAYMATPPAPHMLQQHFYHAQDIDLRLPKALNLQDPEEVTFIKHTRIPNKSGKSIDGVLIGFEGKLIVLEINNGKFIERGTISKFSGNVVDAVLLLPINTSNSDDDCVPSVIMVTQAPERKEIDIPEHPPYRGNVHLPRTMYTTTGYITQVQAHSFVNPGHVQILLNTPFDPVPPSVKGIDPPTPTPFGCLKLYAADGYLSIASGTSGEVFVLAYREDATPYREDTTLWFECIGKFWTSIQPQAHRRDSSHGRASDTDMSPADGTRGFRNTDRAILDMNGRWLAICPVSSPSRASIRADVHPGVARRRNLDLESTGAPPRPTVTCEIDSPDVDTILSKVARGVTQELVKGAKWLGDQSYQTWQSYWKKDQSPPVATSGQQQRFSPPSYPVYYAQHAFPPTHGDAVPNAKEPELVSIIDLRMLDEGSGKRTSAELKPLATFEPLRGCSFLSFSPHGLNLFTAGRRGDVLYVWDLMQLRYSRRSATTLEDERNSPQPCVRQLTRQERSSDSTVVDVAWDSLVGSRFAVLTKNKTVHLYDLPRSASRWPPAMPRRPKAQAPKPNPPLNADQTETVTGGFFASAMNIANKAQPIVSGWRGRAPSMGGGFVGIGTTGIGLASATGVKGGKAVAAGLSKSLGAASETVNSIRHAGDGRLHLRCLQEASAGKIFWSRSDRKTMLVVLNDEVMKSHHIRKTESQDKRSTDTISIFDVRKAVVIKLPRSDEMAISLSASTDTNSGDVSPTRWRTQAYTNPEPIPHPLSLAEIDTNAPYQPFHTDRRVTLFCYTKQSKAREVSPKAIPGSKRSSKGHDMAINNATWLFGDDIDVTRLDMAKSQISDDENDDFDLQIRRETTVASSVMGDNDMEQITSSTRRSKKKKPIGARNDRLVDLPRGDTDFEDDFSIDDGLI